MRDLSLILALAALAPLAFRFPFVGVYLWEWLSLMNPHRLVYSFAQNQPFNMIVAGITILAWIFSRDRKNFRFDATMGLLLLFAAWITLTTLLAPVPEITNPLWSRNIKTMLLLVVVMAIITTRVRLHGLIWVIAISLGYFGIKGGGFMILTGGHYIVFGPAQSMIEDNNALALALIMVLPLMNYLRQHAETRIVKFAVIAVGLLTFAAAVGSYSRGGFVALAAMLGFMWLKSRTKIATGLATVALVAGLLAVMPEKYLTRMSTVETMSEDASFQGRLDAWEVAWKTALDRPLGAGFDGPRQDVIWGQYLPDARPRASHSIYFMVLGEHGFIGLALYLAICFVAWRNLARVIALTRDKPEFLWAKDMAVAVQVAMVGFLVGGAALPMAYYDGFLTLIAMAAVLRHLVENKVAPVLQPQRIRPRPVGEGDGASIGAGTTAS